MPHVVWDIRPGDGLRLSLKDVVFATGVVLCLPAGLVSTHVGLTPSVLFTAK